MTHAARPVSTLLITIDELQLLDTNALQLNSGSEDVQSEDEDPNAENDILDPPRIDGIPAGDPLAIEDGLSNIDEKMSESHYSDVNQEDATLTLSMLDESKKEAAADRKRDLHVELEKEVTQSTEGCFRKAEYSHIHPKILKKTGPGT